MSEKLSYEDWKKQFAIDVPTKTKENFDIDVINAEVEKVLKKEYQSYLVDRYDFVGLLFGRTRVYVDPYSESNTNMVVVSPDVAYALGMSGLLDTPSPEAINLTENIKEPSTDMICIDVSWLKEMKK